MSDPISDILEVTARAREEGLGRERSPTILPSWICEMDEPFLERLAEYMAMPLDELTEICRAHQAALREALDG